MSRREDSLEGFPSDKPVQPLLDRQSMAGRVAELRRDHRARDRWREMVRAAFAESRKRHGDHDIWQKRLQEHFAQALKRHQKGEKEPKEPPAEGWTWGIGFVPAADGQRMGPVVGFPKS